MNNTLTGRGDPERVSIVDVAPRFFELLGVQPAMGRLFTAEEYIPNSPRVVLVGHDYWLRRFGGNRDIVGTHITVNERPTLVAGVLPPTFDFSSVFTPGTRVDFVKPAELDTMRPWGNTLSIIARLKPGTTIERARAELDALVAPIRADNRDIFQFAPLLTPLQERVSGTMRRPLYVLWARSDSSC